MKVPARLLLALVILALFIANQGVFAQMASAVQGTIQGVTVKQSQATPTEQPLPAAIPVQVSGTTGGSTSAAGGIGQAAQAAGAILPLIGGF